MAVTPTDLSAALVMTPVAPADWLVVLPPAWCLLTGALLLMLAEAFGQPGNTDDPTAEGDVGAGRSAELSLGATAVLFAGAVLSIGVWRVGPENLDMASLAPHLIVDRFSLFMWFVLCLGGAFAGLFAGGYLPEHRMDREQSTSTPRVALAHDWLCGLRGGELVLDAIVRALSARFRVDTVYTMFDDGRALTPAIDALRRVAPGLSRIPGAPSRLRRWMLPLYPAMVESLGRRVAADHHARRARPRRAGRDPAPSNASRVPIAAGQRALDVPSPVRVPAQSPGSQAPPAGSTPCALPPMR